MTTFTKSELRAIRIHLARLLPPGGRPPNAEEVVEIGGLVERADELIRLYAPTVERGELVFSWRVPRDLALTGNAYAGSRGWKKHKDRKLLDAMLVELLPAFPKAKLHGAHRRRWIRGTRFSPKRVDETALDLIGAKLCIDSLKRANVIHDDDEKHVHREARQEKCKAGGTHLLLEVFEIADEQVSAPEPANESVTQLVRTPGSFTQMLIDSKKGAA